MATASISLIREQSESVRPPRALWVPYALGRPLGSAEDPEFQKNVIRASLAMLETATERTIEDYPVEAPDEAGPGVWACPLNLEVEDDDTHTGRLLAEVARLRPWSAETRAQRGRTLFGITGASPDQVDEVAAALGSIADGGDIENPPPSDTEWAFAMPLLVRHLADDLRTFYHEAIAAQPGPGAPNHDALNDWIFGGTALGTALQAVADHLTETDTPMAKLVRGFLIPEGHYQGGSAFPATPEFGTPKGE
ncbi:MAG: hypothetical protein GY929_15855 [Actinomycetia bacterium]|nr:hypothetical protein [Actinomycetes bacterium]